MRRFPMSILLITGFVFSLLAGVFRGSGGAIPAAAKAAVSSPAMTLSIGPVLINEFVFDHAGADSDEFIELFGAADSDWRSLSLVVVNSDLAQLGVIDAAIPVGGSDTQGYWLAGLATDTIENDSLTLFLLENFSGFVGDDLDTNNDGTLDLSPWTAVLDSIAVSDGDAGDLFYSPVILTPGFDGYNAPVGGASRIPNGANASSVAVWMRNDFDLAGLPGFTGTAVPGEAFNTPGSANLPVVLINEFVLDHTGTDTYEYLEILGEANKNYSGLTILEIEGDGSGAGVIDEVVHLGFTGPTGHWSDGFYTNKLENGSLTLLLVQEFSGVNGSDLDTDNDGFLDSTPWLGVLDSIAVTDGTLGDLMYSPLVLSPGFDGVALGVGGASRIPDGIETNTTADWLRNDFDLAGITGFVGTPVYGEALNTPGTVNIKYLPPDDLSISKTGPASVQPGQTFDYTILLQNTSTAPAAQVILTDTLPVAVQYLADDSGATPQNPQPGVYVWQLGDLPGLSSKTIHISVALDQNLTAPSLLNQASASTLMPTDDPLNNTASWTLRVAYPLAIHDIQGEAHSSPYNDYLVSGVHGIVTAKSDTGFYMQTPDTQADASPATSEGILVFTGGAPNVDVGDLISVTATVDEFFPGGIDSGNLSITELVLPRIVVVSSNNLAPVVTLIGNGGRMPPTEIIDNDSTGTVDTALFDPAQDGIDFFESLEGMLVGVEQALVVGPTNRQGEITVAPDAGLWAGVKTVRGGLVVQASDFNPERIIIDDALVALEPQVDTGASFSQTINGVMDYSQGNYKLLNTLPLPAASGSLAKETTLLVRETEQISLASLNVAGLDANPADGDDDTARFALLAQQIVTHLDAPDILALQDVQDNSGVINDGVVAADQTYAALVAAISSAGGPNYAYTDIAPLNNQDGGTPGGNMRVGYLYRSDRGLALVSRPGGDAVSASVPVSGGSGVELTFSPGRIDPANPAFTNNRKALAAEFSFNGYTLFVINATLKPQDGDSPLFGLFQPPLHPSEPQRLQQAQVINDFVDDLLALDANAMIALTGTMNDHPFSPALTTLAGGVLANLHQYSPLAERYTHNQDGNSQALDHTLLSPRLLSGAAQDVVHLNSEYDSAERVSDHDPLLVRLTITEIPQFTNFLPLLLK